MKKLIAALLLLAAQTVFAATPTIVGTPVTVGNTTSGNTSTGGTGSYTITASGDDLIIDVTAVYHTATFSLSSITTSSGSITTDKAFAASLAGSIYLGTGIYRIHNATAASYTITLSWSVSVNGWAMMLAQGHGIAGLDVAIPTQTGGSSVSPATGSITVSSGDLVVALIGDGTGGNGSSLTWTSPFVQFAYGGFTSIGMDIFAADDAPAAGAISAAGTFGASATWIAQIAAYSGSATAVCTHAGITSAGGTAVPNGTTGSYWLKSGSFGTPNCSTTFYWCPALGNFCTN